MNANLYRCSIKLFTEKVASIGIPFNIGYFGYHPTKGIAVPYYEDKSGRCERTLTCSNYFHDLAHIVLLVLQNKIERLGQLNFGMELGVISQPTKKLAYTIFLNEAKVAGIQVKLAQHFGFKFDKEALYRTEAKMFSDFSVDIDSGLALETFTLADLLPIKTQRPKMLDSADDNDLWNNPTLLAAWGMYNKRKERAVRTLIKQWIKEHEDTYSTEEILNALAKAECYYANARS